MDRIVASEQAYIPNTAILQTTLTDQTGASIRITDFVPRFRQYDRIFRPGMLFRRIEPVSGLARIRIRIRPRFNYGAVVPTRTVGSNHIRYVAPDNTLRVTTDGSMVEVAPSASVMSPVAVSRIAYTGACGPCALVM